MSVGKTEKDEMFKGSDLEAVVKTAPESVKWHGFVQWPHPDDWEMEHWDFYRTTAYSINKKRKKPPYDLYREEFITGLHFTMEYGTANFKGVDISKIVSGKEPINPRFMNWFRVNWNAYVHEILNPNG